MKLNLRNSLCALAIGLFAAGASAAGYPSRTITMVNPYPAGGSTDALARIVARSVSETLGQPVVVENKAGAAGTIAAQYVMRAKPDGYTFMLTSEGILAINPSVYKRLNYDPVKSFTSLAVAVRIPIVLAVPANSKYKTFEDIQADIKARPGALTYGSAGIGSSQHLAGELYKSMAKLDMLHVPYKGGAPAMLDLLGGRLDMMFVQVPSAEPQVKAGKLRLLAIGSPERSPDWPDVPTFAEKGLTGYDSDTWYGFNMPPGTPPDIQKRLHGAIEKALVDNDKQLKELGFVPLQQTPEDMDKTVKTGIERWEKVIRGAGFFRSQ